ncbi:Pectate lyase superfamily protein [uncultured Caudovirales phage]|uniref:Pectate lyase superfamily protein n=1 Tax=uncultured Caudovirales phage TaxID=2100421 RepID=A0A6J7WDE6_9CAUD|nr:Pectate lyase superfamily protein [uncultured Caudovirales phage]
MAGTKISELPVATLPLTGSELVPVVQSGATKQTTLATMPYVPTGTGAVTTTVQAKLREMVSVKDFGAVGDGVTDDTVAIQNALNYIATTGFAGYQGNTLYFPPGKYIITNTLKPAMASGVANIRLIGAGVTDTIIEWAGATDLTKAMFGLYAADIGTVTNSLFDGIRWKGKGKVGYVVLFETTDTSGGAARRENENNMFRQCWFEGAKRALVMFGDYSIDTNAAYIASGDDINVNTTTFDNCTFLNFEGYGLKQVGGNVYNTILRNCFMWSGNNTDVTSANAKNYIFSVSAGMTVIQGGCFQKLENTGANDGTDKIACLRGAFADFHVFAAQSEDARVIYHNNEGDPTKPQYLNGIYVNDSRAINDNEWAIYNESSSPFNVSSCSFGHLAGSDNYRNVYSIGALHWSDSVTAKTAATKMVIGSANFAQSTFNSRPFDRSRPINEGWAVDSWEVPAATFRNATTIDYYLNGFFKAFGTSAQGTLQQVTSASYSRVVPRLDCTVVGSTSGLRFSMREKLDVKPYRGNAVWVLVAGQHDGTFTTNTQLPVQMFTDSSGGTSSGVLFQNGNLFVSYYKQEISSTATYIQAELNVKKVGYVDIINFLAVPDEYGIQSALFAIAQYTRGNTVKFPAVFEANGLSEAFQSASQTYSDTLSDYENAVYFVSANHNDAGAETAIVLAHRVGANAYVSKVSSLNSGAGASITASTVGAVVNIVLDGTSLAHVKKLQLNNL